MIYPRGTNAYNNHLKKHGEAVLIQRRSRTFAAVCAMVDIVLRHCKTDVALILVDDASLVSESDVVQVLNECFDEDPPFHLPHAEHLWEDSCLETDVELR